MVAIEGKIQDLLTDMSEDVYVHPAHDHEEFTLIQNNDITILNDVEALWAAIVGVLKTPLGYIDGVTLEGYGSRLMELEGMPLENWHIRELGAVYIRDTIPQFQGYVRSFPDIVITPSPESSRDKFWIKIDITVDSVFGPFTRTFYL